LTKKGKMVKDEFEGKTIRVLRQRPTSLQGYRRLGQKEKRNFLNKVYPIAFTGKVSYNILEYEERIAKWLKLKFGSGIYVILPYERNPKTKQKSLGKMLIKIKITDLGENKLDYEVLEDKRIRRMLWYIG